MRTAPVDHAAPGEPADQVVEIDLGPPLVLRAPNGVTEADVRLSFQGFLTNRTELGDAQHVSATGSDADVALAAYRQWGADGLARLRGTFTVALLDSAAQVAMVARDPLGMHPVFYAKRGATILFATRPQALTARPGVSRALNAVALADHLCLRWPDPEETFFSAVRRLPAGSRAICTNGVFRIERYWDPGRAGDAIPWIEREEDIQFDRHLERAVDRCLSAGPSAIFLSGGLDSISVAAMATTRAARAPIARPVALSLAFPDPVCDESALQTAVARELGLRQHLVGFWEAVSPRGLLCDALDLNRNSASPVLNTWGPAYLALARRGYADGVRTILTGNGGDEWLSQSPYLSADLIRRGDWSGTFRLLRAWRRSHRRSSPRQAWNILWRFGARPLAGLALSRVMPQTWEGNRRWRAVRQDPAWVGPDPALRAAQRERSARSLGASDPEGGFYLREMRESLRHHLIAWEMEEMFEFGRRVGVRYLHPYWDADLVDVLYRTRPALLDAGGRSKGLVRQSLARRFPALGLERQPKLAATSFHRAVMVREGPALLSSVRNFATLAALGVVDNAQAVEAARRSFAGPARNRKLGWTLMNLESWAAANT